MKTSAEIQLRMALGNLDVERTALKRELPSYLRNMVRDIESALSDIENDNSVNGHLMQHAASIAEQIGRWNLIKNLTPYLKGQS